MEFSKQENVSRQSSILKLPKQRQPLQCVATNSSSSENSPTVKIKRRVSFAKNRRIREFCNEAEPESVWDDTYEEHDLSSTKSNCSNTNEHPVIISVPCDDKENFPVQLFLQNNQLECKEIQMVNQNKQDYLLQDHVEINRTINNIDPKITDIQNKDKNALSTIFYNDVMDITTNISVNMHCRNQVASSLGDTVLVSQTCTQGTSVKIIEDVPLMSDIGQKIKLDINTEKSCQDKENLSNSIQTKFTSTLPSSAWIKSNRQHKIVDESETINKTVKVTRDMYNNTFDNQIINKTIDLSKDIKNFSNKLIERINIVHDKLNEHKAMQEQTKVSSEKSMEITEAVPNCNTNHQTNTKIEKLFCEVLQDNVKNSSNQSINIPIAGSVYNRNYQLGAGTNQVVCEEMKKTPKILSNISMEIIKNVPTYETNYQSGTDVKNISHKMIDDQTKISTDKAINVKETVFLGSQNDETTKLFLFVMKVINLQLRMKRYMM
ncbi:PREDICTED: uncharacterized protein LOC105361213 [Ceratosolen solmsi marchali]|uniref:Uncharacterized protein LOC105361213 n=1 Tax=Ceratosolen solmsi marchali TaxID=326594 RepID=A0AAJ6YEJ6_9HYME|nr:PREDICTED: uncharacterized protein LOC105361213 [Ceratosolen solmsi marchali]